MKAICWIDSEGIPCRVYVNQTTNDGLVTFFDRGDIKSTPGTIKWNRSDRGIDMNELIYAIVSGNFSLTDLCDKEIKKIDEGCVGCGGGNHV